MKSVNTKFKFFKELVNCCYPLFFWEYDRDLTLIGKLTPENELSEYFFRYSSAAASLREYIAADEYMPVLLSDNVGIMWIAVPERSEKEPGHTYVLGPMFINESAPLAIRKRIYDENQPHDIRRRVSETLNNIPVIPSVSMFQYALMLNYCINGTRITTGDIRHQIKTQTRIETPDSQSSEGSMEKRKCDLMHSGISELDRQLLTAVQNGDMNYKKIMERSAVLSSGVRTRNLDSLRNAKNSAILFTGLCSRAAIAGSVPASISYNLCDTYIDLIESCRAVTEVIEINHAMVDEYVKSVQKYRSESSSYSKPIQTCIDYIDVHFKESPSIDDLSNLCGYAGYYLSRKFKSETGQSISEYINLQKIRRAKSLLKSSNLSVQEISDQLGFCSRSYFTSVFEKIEGCSPTSFKEK